MLDEGKEMGKNENHMVRILPINENPIVDGYTHHAYSQAILTNLENWKLLKVWGYENWFYSNYIQLISKDRNSECFSLPIDFFVGDVDHVNDYNYIPFLSAQYSDKQGVWRVGNEVDYMVQLIEAGYYVECTINEKYVPGTLSYENKDFYHQTLFYGFDLEKEIFYIFHFEADGHFRANKLTFKQFEKSFTTSHNVEDVNWIEKVKLLKIKEPEYYFPMDLELIKYSLKEYLEKRNTFRMIHYAITEFPKNFGLDIYSDVIYYLTEYYGDERILHLLLLHKIVMCKRIDYLYENKCLDRVSYEKLKEMAENIKNNANVQKYRYIKCFLTERKNLGKIERDLILMREEEKKLYEMLLECLDKHNV